MNAPQQATRRLLRAAAALVATTALGLGMAAPSFADSTPAVDQTTVSSVTTYVVGDAPVADTAAAQQAAAPDSDTTVLPDLQNSTSQAPTATWSTTKGKLRKKHARSSVRRASPHRAARS